MQRLWRRKNANNNSWYQTIHKLKKKNMERELAGLCVEQIVRLIASFFFSSKICCPYLVFYIPEVLSFLKLNQSTHTTLGIRVIWFIEFIGRHSVRGALHNSALRLCNALPQCIKDIVKACKYISKHYLLESSLTQ